MAENEAHAREVDEPSSLTVTPQACTEPSSANATGAFSEKLNDFVGDIDDELLFNVQPAPNSPLLDWDLILDFTPEANANCLDGVLQLEEAGHEESEQENYVQDNPEHQTGDNEINIDQQISVVQTKPNVWNFKEDAEPLPPSSLPKPIYLRAIWLRIGEVQFQPKKDGGLLVRFVFGHGGKLIWEILEGEVFHKFELAASNISSMNLEIGSSDNAEYLLIELVKPPILYTKPKNSENSAYTCTQTMLLQADFKCNSGLLADNQK